MQKDISKPLNSEPTKSEQSRNAQELASDIESYRNEEPANHEIESRSGISVGFNRIVQIDEVLEAFTKIDPEKAASFRSKSIKVYLRDDSIVMLKRKRSTEPL